MKHWEKKNLAALQDYCREAEPYTVLLPSACAISSQLLPEAALLFDQETCCKCRRGALSPVPGGAERLPAFGGKWR